MVQFCNDILQYTKSYADIVLLILSNILDYVTIYEFIEYRLILLPSFLFGFQLD